MSEFSLQMSLRQGYVMSLPDEHLNRLNCEWENSGKIDSFIDMQWYVHGK